MSEEKIKQAIAGYKEQFGKLPKDADTLIAFSQQKESGVAKLSKKKAEAVTAALAEAKKKKPKKKKSAASAAAPAEEEEAPAAKKKKAPKQEFAIDAMVLLSSDRIGIVRWFGFLPSRKGYFYGVEFIGSFVGNCDGAVDGVRYFQTAKERAKFFPPAKIRKVATKKDMTKILGHERTQSWIDAQVLATSVGTSASEAALDTVPDDAPVEDAKDDGAEEDGGDADADGADADDGADEEEPAKSSPKKGRSSRSSTVVDGISVEVVGARETALEFILRQDEDTRGVLLDVYTHPSLNALFLGAFEQVRALETDQQADVWRELISRWRCHL